MNSTVNFASIGAIGATAQSVSRIPASRGVLAVQGTVLSSVASIFGADLQAPKHLMEQDKPERGWQPVNANAIAGTYGTDRQAGLRTIADHLDATHRSVIRVRHRSRTR
ncbi:hypothetical protein [Nocardia stercoris]|uniref:hypothetical protein n=1 Tax=Nocardia stercoris TaxID=2483361 RepID=UPI0011C3A02E|nr:hypothetical protein [Nocardia stercoris]